MAVSTTRSRTLALLLIAAPFANAQYTFDPASPEEQASGHLYFGAAKDDKGAYVPDASVLLEIGQTNYIFVTDRMGRYRGRLAVEARGAEVKAGCSKPGYELVRVTKRPASSGGKAALQVDCVLRRAV